MTTPIFQPSAAVQRIEAISRRVQQPASDGQLISLAIGEPDFDTPPRIVEAAVTALHDGRTHYSPLKGDAELREALAERVTKLLGSVASADQIQVTHGGSGGLAATILAVVNPGDRVVIPDPTYSLYADLIALAGGQVVPVPLGEDLHWDLDALQDALSTASLFVFCNPSNPTGIVHSRAELEAIGEMLQGTSTMVLSDEAYADLVYTSEPFTSVLEVESLRDRSIYCQTFSKSYAMTGWRLGYLWGPQSVINSAGRIHATLLGSPNTFVQQAGLVALSECDDEVSQMREQYTERQRVMYEALRQIPGLDVVPPEGAFYLFPRYHHPMSSAEMVGFLRDNGVAVRPGAEFGTHGEGHLRLSFAASTEAIIEGVTRLREAIAGIV